MEKPRIFTASFAGVYPHYVQKAEKKGRTKEEVDTIICWLTGYNQQQLQQQIDKKPVLKLFLNRRHKYIRMRQKLPALFAVTVWKLLKTS